jgi:hypothetical protein
VNTRKNIISKIGINQEKQEEEEKRLKEAMDLKNIQKIKF